MNFGESSNEQISPEQFQVIIETEFRKPRPQWAKKASIRILQLINPQWTVNQLLDCFESSTPIEKMIAALDLPWLLGRLARFLAETKKLNLENFGPLRRLNWLWNFPINDAEGQLQNGKGLQGVIAYQLQSALRQDVETQMRFWNSFADGFTANLPPRPQDIKSLKVYLFLALKWEDAQCCLTIRQLYDLVFQTLPKETCPPDVDQIDFEDRQIKWFEKLCHRNLGLSLGKRGRPKTGK